ncbi:MAG TPA: HAMP domain-containing protein, partial [Chloroflexota bacterium]|nr:HAMP domain-containing protein [Chloroflexota bacterium]
MRPLKSLKLLGHHLRDSLLSIRVRLTLWYVVFLGLVLVVFGAFLYANLARSLPRQIAHDVKVEANQLASTLNLENGTPTLAGTLNELPPGMVVVLYNAAGQQLDTSDAHQPLPALPAALQAARTGVGSTNTARTPGGNEWEVVTIPIRNNQHIAGILQVAQSDAQAHGALDQLVVFMAISIPLVLLMAVVGGLFLASRALGPIDRVTRAAQRIGAEDLSQRLHFPRNADEIGRLASTFDDMLDRLQRAFQLQRQFTADASHELRTPLAMLVSRTELALERARRAPEYRLALEETHKDAVRMSQLLAELLTLARADSGREEILR